MKQLIRVITVIVFIGALATVAIGFYEGMVQKTYPLPLSIAIYVMDYSFMIATALHLYYYRTNRVIRICSVISALLIIAGYVIRFTVGSYPAWVLLVYDFYIMMYYGILVLKRTWKQEGKRDGI